MAFFVKLCLYCLIGTEIGNTEMSYLNLTVELQLGFQGYGWARVLSLAGEPGPVMGGVRPAVETVVYVDAETPLLPTQ